MQGSYYVGYSFLLQLLSFVVAPQTLRPFMTLMLWLMPLAFGPAAVNYAVRAKYIGFRLQAYGYRDI